jgi:hypothetical protein
MKTDQVLALKTDPKSKLRAQADALLAKANTADEADAEAANTLASKLQTRGWFLREVAALHELLAVDEAAAADAVAQEWFGWFLNGSAGCLERVRIAARDASIRAMLRPYFERLVGEREAKAKALEEEARALARAHGFNLAAVAAHCARMASRPVSEFLLGEE